MWRMSTLLAGWPVKKGSHLLAGVFAYWRAGDTAETLTGASDMSAATVTVYEHC